MSRAGGPHTPNAPFERIAAAIRSLPHGTEFGCQDIHPLVSDLRRGTVNCFFSLKRKAGWLDQVTPGKYRIGGVLIKTTLPMGLVAEAVWAVLFTSKDQKPLRMPEVVGEAEAYVNRPGVSLYGTAGSVLRSWHRSGYLERTGNRGEYAYRLKDGITERPVTTR
jgi:hypothetical protein